MCNTETGAHAWNYQGQEQIFSGSCQLRIGLLPVHVPLDNWHDSTTGSPPLPVMHLLAQPLHSARLTAQDGATNLHALSATLVNKGQLFAHELTQPPALLPPATLGQRALPCAAHETFVSITQRQTSETACQELMAVVPSHRPAAAQSIVGSTRRSPAMHMPAQARHSPKRSSAHIGAVNRHTLALGPLV